MKQRSKSQAGFSLVEVVIAIGVTAFCLIPISGLLLVGTHTTQNSGQQAVAASIGAEVATALQATDSQGHAYLPEASSDSDSNPGMVFQIQVPPVGNGPSPEPVTIYMDEDGNASNAPLPTTRYAVTLFFTPPANVGQKNATLAQIMVTWPGQSQAAGAWPTTYQGSWETETALNIN